MENKYPFLKMVIRKDIEYYSKQAEQYDQAAEEAYKDWLVMKEEKFFKVVVLTVLKEMVKVVVQSLDIA